MDAYEVAKVVLVIVIAVSIALISIQTVRILQIAITSLNDIKRASKKVTETIDDVVKEYNDAKEKFTNTFSGTNLWTTIYIETIKLINSILDVTVRKSRRKSKNSEE